MPLRPFGALLLLLLSSSCGLSSASGGGADSGTVEVSFAGNLDARAPVREDQFLTDSPGKSSELSAVVQVRGEESGRYPLAFYFRKEAISMFAFYVFADVEGAFAPGEESSSGGSGSSEAALVGQGSLVFDTDGGLLSVTPNEPLEVQFRGTPRPQTITLNFGSPKEEGGDGLSGFTQYALTSSVTYQSAE